MKITIIGTGYVGLTTAACPALNHTIYCYDKDEQNLKAIEEGHSPIYEEELEPLIKKGRASHQLHTIRNLPDAIAQSDLSFICVGTPSLRNGRADLT